MPATPLYQGAVRPIAARIASTDGTNFISLLTGGTSGTIITHLQITSTVASARTLSLVVTVSGVDYPIGVFTVAANQGTTAGSSALGIFGNISSTPAPVTTGIVTELDAIGNKIYKLANGASLRASITLATTAGTFVNFVGAGGDL